MPTTFIFSMIAIGIQFAIRRYFPLPGLVNAPFYTFPLEEKAAMKFWLSGSWWKVLSSSSSSSSSETVLRDEGGGGIWLSRFQIPKPKESFRLILVLVLELQAINGLFAVTKKVLGEGLEVGLETFVVSRQSRKFN